MAEAKKPAASPVTVEDPAPKRAAESSDPAVHQLLAEHATAVANGDAERADEVVARLARLGFGL